MISSRIGGYPNSTGIPPEAVRPHGRTLLYGKEPGSIPGRPPAIFLLIKVKIKTTPLRSVKIGRAHGTVAELVNAPVG